MWEVGLEQVTAVREGKAVTKVSKFGGILKLYDPKWGDLRVPGTLQSYSLQAITITDGDIGQ